MSFSAAFACGVCGARAATPNADDELVCDVCGTLSQVNTFLHGWIGSCFHKYACVDGLDTGVGLDSDPSLSPLLHATTTKHQTSRRPS